MKLKPFKPLSSAKTMFSLLVGSFVETISNSGVVRNNKGHALLSTILRRLFLEVIFKSRFISVNVSNIYPMRF